MERATNLTLDFLKENKIFLLCGLTFALFAGSYHTYFGSNQNTYLLHAFLLANPEYLIADWYGNTVDGNPVFSYITSYLFRLGDLFVINFNKVFEIIFFVFLAKMVFKDYPRKNQLELALLLLLIALMSFYFPIFSGLKGQYILGNIYQPSIYGVILLPALFYYLDGQNFKSLCCLFIATTFHPSLILTTGILGILFLTHLRKNDQKITFLILGVLILLPSFLYIYLKIYDPDFSVIASGILVNFRIPHHADLSSFGWLDVVRLLILGLSVVLCRDPVLKKILIMGLGFIIFFIVLVNILDETGIIYDPLKLLFPMRLSIVFLPVAVVIVCSEIFLKLKSYVGGFINDKMVLVLLLFTVSLVAYFSISPVFQAQNKYVNWNSYSSPEKVWLIPVQDDLGFSQGIRLNLKQPVFVDKKSHPVNNSEIIEWKKRVDLSERFYTSKNKQEQQLILKEIHAISQIDYILVRDSNAYFMDSQRIFESDGLTLYKIK